jgi:DNA-binding XRE family transcriptional regulator
MPRGVPISEDEEATIKAALTAKPHALLVARESRGAWSYATVWRVADRAGIPLTAGRETMGRRLSAEQRAVVIEARRNSPNGTQEEIARAAGVSRVTVSRIERGDRRRAGGPRVG